jgi:hypothetical protein
MIYIPSSIKIGSGIEKFTQRTQRQADSEVIALAYLYFSLQNKGSKLIMCVLKLEEILGHNLCSI